MAKSWRCYVALHRYVPTKSEDGTTTFLRCKDCGKDKDVPPHVGTHGG